MLSTLRQRQALVIGFSLVALFTIPSLAQTPAARITREIDNSVRATIRGTHPPMARAENDVGRVPSETQLQGISVVFSRTAAQEAGLETLIAAQQNPASPLYHKWLSPEEFAARFGVADSDIARVKAWLEQQGFTVDGVSRSKNRITFSGTVGQVEDAFGTELHYYQYETNGKTYFAPSGDISVPAALAPVVMSVTNLSSFRPRPGVRVGRQPAIKPNATFGQAGYHFMTPGDVATVYDINGAYQAGYNGTGQSIAVVGQSAIQLSDIENFQSAAGLPVKDPTVTLVPNSGTSAVSSGDERESDLDLEYSGGIAPGATIIFVYVGNEPNYGVANSLIYAVDNDIAPIISVSYSSCEAALSSSDYSTLNAVLAQAATQGQSVIAAAGDSGSTGCYGDTTLPLSVQQTPAVNFPASSQYVTAIGGTEFPAADVAPGNTAYWQSANGGDVISSALSYIPEQVWNDDSSAGLSSGGGGVSTFTPMPSWQTGVPGITSGSYRLLPDVSLDSSNVNAPYLICSSDPVTGITGSCANGFLDSTGHYLTAIGGTSVAAPIFAGMLAIINGKLNSSGQGVINPVLYTLAADPATYASAFHDITGGGNQCTAGPSYCSSAGASEYAATTGYDEASGLGSVDFLNLMMAWPASSSTDVTSTTTASAATMTPAPGATDTITITVASASSSSTTTPTGSLAVAVDGTTVASSLALSNGSATYNFSSKSLGAHIITATYPGNSTYASSSSTLTVTVTAPSFTIAASSLTVSGGNSGFSTIAITPKDGYTGTIRWNVSSSPSLNNGCFSLPNTVVSGGNAVTATMTVYTTSSACSGASSIVPVGDGRKFIDAFPSAYRNELRSASDLKRMRTCVALVGLLCLGLLGYRPRRLRRLAAVFLLATACFAASSCGGSGGSAGSGPSLPSTSYAAKGTYTVTIVGTDTSSASTTASAAITLTID